MSDIASIEEQFENIGRILAVLEDENVEVDREGVDIHDTNPSYTDFEIQCRLYHGENE